MPAIYDGKRVRLLEAVSFSEPYRVLITFVEPAGDDEEVVPPRDLARFWSSLGAWKDDRPVEETLREIHESRHSQTEPPPS